VGGLDGMSVLCCLPVASGVVHMVVAMLACGALEKPFEKWGLLRSSYYVLYYPSTRLHPLSGQQRISFQQRGRVPTL